MGVSGLPSHRLPVSGTDGTTPGPLVHDLTAHKEFHPLQVARDLTLLGYKLVPPVIDTSINNPLSLY